MFMNILFSCLTLSQQVSLIRKCGILLGTRKREGRIVYTYMYRNLFAEIIYQDDDPNESAESFIVITSLRKLADHFKKEIKSKKT